MTTGRVDKRFNEARGKYRFRFHAIAPDHAETILLALEHARGELGTQFDSVALDAICQHYLATAVRAEHRQRRNNSERFAASHVRQPIESID
jgi:hypothetical protein